jgi:hypothetical protein
MDTVRTVIGIFTIYLSLDGKTRWAVYGIFRLCQVQGRTLKGSPYNMERKLAEELIIRWQQKPREQTIVIIQDKKSVEDIKTRILVHTQNQQLAYLEIFCLIEQRLNAQFQTRYFISSKSLALLNIMLLAKQTNNAILPN